MSVSKQLLSVMDDPILTTPVVENASVCGEKRFDGRESLKNRGWRESLTFPLFIVLLAFPTLTVLFASIGFLFGAGVTAWCGGLGFLGAVFFAYVGGETRIDGLKRIGWLVLILLAIFALDSIFVLFSWWDAQAYHLPAAKFLLEGWNPVFEATREQLLASTGADPANFNPYHVAYLPRAGWIWSAVTASFTGNLESGDTLILITATALGGLAWQVTPLLFAQGRWKRIFFTSLVVLSPGVVASVFCGAQDGSLYALLLMSMLASCAYRKTGARVWLGAILFAPILGCNLKFTGVITLLITAFVFTIPVVLAVLHGRLHAWVLGRWILAHTIGFTFALIVGFSPYLTNWSNHGGPFYPQHSFNQDEVLPAMTADFDLLNDDAAAMGYCGRVTNAYLSKWLAHRFYEWKLHKKPFNPVFHLDQVSGLGTGFRIVMVLTLLALCFTRRCSMPWLLLTLILTSFIQPTRYIGYVRYVPQFWMFPVLIAFNAMTVNIPHSPWIGRALGVTVTAIMATSTYVFALSKMILALGMTEYALSLVETMRSETAPRAYILSLHDRYREDGRCLAAWETLPRDIPSPHAFDVYYRQMLPESGVHGIVWQTPAQMRDLRSANTPRFYLGEHLWYWPQDPTRIRHPDMHFYAGQVRRPLTVRGVLRMAGDVIPDLPRHLIHVTRFRWEQLMAALMGHS
ncbi:MAG: hypothetical protein RSD41_01535 [Kiritimatiellia bacterium]